MPAATNSKDWLATVRSIDSAGADSLEERVGHDQTVDLVRTLVDLRSLGVTHVALDRELTRVAIAAEELHGVRGDTHRRVRGGPLGQRRSLGDALATVLGLCRGARERSGRGHLLGHLGEHE